MWEDFRLQSLIRLLLVYGRHYCSCQGTVSVQISIIVWAVNFLWTTLKFNIIKYSSSEIYSMLKKKEQNLWQLWHWVSVWVCWPFFLFLSVFLPSFLSGFLPPFRCFFTSLRWIWLLNGVLYWLHPFDIWPCCHKQGNPRLWVLLVSPLSLAFFLSASASVCLSLLHLWVLHRLVTWPLILQRRICARG